MASKSVDREIYSISLPRRIPREIRDLEETERKRRMQEGVDPIMMAKMARVQRDLLMRVPSETVISRVRETVASTHITEKAKQYGQVVTDTLGNLGHKAAEMLHTAQEKITGASTTTQPAHKHYSTIPAPTAATFNEVQRLEEQERERRLHESKNSQLEQKRVEIQRELKQTVHPK